MRSTRLPLVALMAFVAFVTIAAFVAFVASVAFTLLIANVASAYGWVYVAGYSRMHATEAELGGLTETCGPPSYFVHRKERKKTDHW